MKVVPKVWYLVGIDLLEAPTTSQSGNRYLLTQTDYFTKYVEAVALSDKNADSVARGLYSTYCRHGAPVHIISDQGREFVNQVIVHCLVTVYCSIKNCILKPLVAFCLVAKSTSVFEWCLTVREGKAN